MEGIQATAPWHFLYFLPLPQGQGSLRPTFSVVTGSRRCGTEAGTAAFGGAADVTVVAVTGSDSLASWMRNRYRTASRFTASTMSWNMSYASHGHSLIGSRWPIARRPIPARR